MITISTPGPSLEDLEIDGKWIDPATDWVFKVPIIELAASPRHVPDTLYLYELAVSKTADSRRVRDAAMARILDKRPYSKLS